MSIRIPLRAYSYTRIASNLECGLAYVFSPALCCVRAIRTGVSSSAVSVGTDRHESDATVLAEIFAPVNYEDFMAVFIVTDFFPADLSQIIRSPQQLTDVHVQVRRVTRLRACRCVLCC